MSSKTTYSHIDLSLLKTKSGRFIYPNSIDWFIKKDIPHLYHQIIEATSFLDECEPLEMRIVCVRNNYILTDLLCQNCQKNRREFDIKFRKFNKNCSKECAKEARYLFLKSRPNPAKLEGFKEKAERTKLERYGDATFNNRKKATETVRRIHGVDNISQIESVKEKKRLKDTVQTKSRRLKTMIRTSKERYEVENPMQSPSILEKNLESRFKAKTYLLPSGRETKIFGNEHVALAFLLERHGEENILFSDRKMYSYSFEGRKRRYYPDFQLTCRKIFYEVKSTYTLVADREMNEAKFNAMVKNGFVMIILVCSHDSVIVEHEWSLGDDIDTIQRKYGQ